MSGKSKENDMLGPLVRNLVRVESHHHGLLRDILNKLQSSNAGDVHDALKRALRKSPTSLDKNFIDCDIAPSCPDGWKIKSHQLGGQVTWLPNAFRFWRSLEQDAGKVSLGDNIYDTLKNLPVVNANVLDWILVHTGETPIEWIGQRVFFWGTIYQSQVSSDRLGVRCIDCRKGAEMVELDAYWYQHCPALLFA